MKYGNIKHLILNRGESCRRYNKSTWWADIISLKFFVLLNEVNFMLGDGLNIPFGVAVGILQVAF